MKIEKWRTSIIGVGPWMVSDNDDPLSRIIGQFREEKHADLFIEALNLLQAQPVDAIYDPTCCRCGSALTTDESTCNDCERTADLHR